MTIIPHPQSIICENDSSHPAGVGERNGGVEVESLSTLKQHMLYQIFHNVHYFVYHASTIQHIYKYYGSLMSAVIVSPEYFREILWFWKKAAAAAAAEIRRHRRRARNIYRIVFILAHT